MGGFLRSVSYFILLVYFFFPHPVCIVPFCGNNHSVCTHNDEQNSANMVRWLIICCKTVDFCSVLQNCGCLCSHTGHFTDIKTSSKKTPQTNKEKKNCKSRLQSCKLASFSFLFLQICLTLHIHQQLFVLLWIWGDKSSWLTWLAMAQE